MLKNIKYGDQYGTKFYNTILAISFIFFINSLVFII